MPWTPDDAPSHDKGAKTPKEQRQWAHIANDVLKRTGDEGRAIREANGIIKKGNGGVGGSRSYDE